MSEAPDRPLREGWTTGTCATAAACAAVAAWRGLRADGVPVGLPDGTRAVLEVETLGVGETWGEAQVRKDAGDDPDATHGLLIRTRVEMAEGGGIRFCAGPGVGTVTRPGLQIPPGEAAVNPAPRRQIEAALRELGVEHALVTVSVPGGEDVAAKTFNPRLGVVGGISILGTSGRVRPFSHEAVEATVRALVSVALAGGMTEIVLTPGHVGFRAARHLWPAVERERVLEVSNAWGTAVDALRAGGARRIVAVGHPGKLAKLAAGDWDTHSSRSKAAAPWVLEAGLKAGFRLEPVDTVEGILTAMEPLERDRFGQFLSKRIADALEARAGIPCAVVLVDMEGRTTGRWGDVPWE